MVCRREEEAQGHVAGTGGQAGLLERHKMEAQEEAPGRLDKDRNERKEDKLHEEGQQAGWSRKLVSVELKEGMLARWKDVVPSREPRSKRSVNKKEGKAKEGRCRVQKKGKEAKNERRFEEDEEKGGGRPREARKRTMFTLPVLLYKYYINKNRKAHDVCVLPPPDRRRSTARDPCLSTRGLT